MKSDIIILISRGRSCIDTCNRINTFLIQYRYVLYIWILRYLKDGMCYMILYDNILAF